MSRPYPRYRNSGVDWLGEVPEFWDVLPTKYANRVVMGQSPPSDAYRDEPVERPFLQGNAEFGKSSPAPKWFCNAAPKVVHAGTILLSVRTPVGALNLADQNYGIGRGLCGIAPDTQRVDNRFAWWALHVTRQALKPLAVGSTYDAVSSAEVGSVDLPVPPLDDQRAIATFLDRETERIDALVAKKRQLIERLQEYHTAVFTRTVTRGLPPEAARAAGLDPSPLLKSSGVAWLGDVPAHWEVKRLRDVTELINGFPFDSQLFDQHEGVPLVRIRDLFTPATEVKWSGDPVPEAEIGDGDILIGMDGDFNVAWWRHGTALLNQRLCCVRAHFGLASQRFLFYCLPFPLKALNDVTYATTVKHLSSLDVLKFRLPIPPLYEQRAIATFLDREMERIDTLHHRVAIAVERLQEYRTALITAAVTGKIDLRDAVPN